MSTHNMNSIKIYVVGYSLESPQRGDFTEYPQHMFLWRTLENYPLIKYPRLFPCCFVLLFANPENVSVAHFTN